jgi:transposase
MDNQGGYEERDKKLPVRVSLKDFNRYILPHLSRARRGPPGKLSRYQIFNHILYVLHTGIQWNRLPIRRNELHWSNVYKWHSRWSKDGSYGNLFEASVKRLLLENKLDLSILHGDGSNTVAKKGGEGSVTPDTNTGKERKS